MSVEDDLATIRSTFPRGTLPFLAGALALYLVALLGPLVEARLFPVVVDHEVRYERRADGTLVMTTTGRKVRDCRAVRRESAATEIGGDELGLVWAKGPSRVDGTGMFALSNRTRLPAGYGRWFEVRAMLRYDCHPLWLTPYHYPTVLVTASDPGP